ncbi:hypothetical protein GL325_06290 [Aeromicrobium sp. 636]|uniref:Uncharacterized protein n=1 Tax=Aeromicrobium senzhongii TaxID=2663859 RepID=A0A8I0K028_9ACTN|nr:MULTISPECIES: hypothetical protein [Aeromicrobium]MBC9225921.1 hypothetical protein [Aeromicrobium senzhongii]MCQ3998028.1 hypothetical protein [Aeromicrobium sp. 636]
MDEQPGPVTWPFYATCAVIVAMGMFLMNGGNRPLAGWLFVIFGAVAIVGSLARAAVDRLRGHRD